jgi:hypothetical protein
MTVQRSSLIAIALVTGACTPLQGQHLDLGLGAVFYVDRPETFTDSPCDGAPAGLTGTASWRALNWLALEGSGSVNGSVGGTTCAIADLIPVPYDVPVVRTVWPDGFRGSSFSTTHLSAVVEPFSTGPVSPRARTGFGRIWNKGVGYRLLGLGVRYRFGRHAFVTDVDAWSFTTREEEWTVVYRADAPPDILSRETIEHDLRLFAVRVGWEVSLGR